MKRYNIMAGFFNVERAYLVKGGCCQGRMQDVRQDYEYASGFLPVEE